MRQVTQEQVAQARSADLLAYLQQYEPHVLKRDGINYRHKEHDSLVYVGAKRYWYWNSRGRSINALDYLMEIRGYGFVDAVQQLTGTHAPPIQAPKPVQKEVPKKLFLPPRYKCSMAAIGYLQQRGITSQVIERCMKLGLFYETRLAADERACVFVGKDDAGKSRYACVRSVNGTVKKDAPGSDKRFSFCYPPQERPSRHVAVFEAAIDALSHASLQELEGWPWNGYRLSLGGTSPVALISFLERHPEIRRVTLHMDNDLAGRINARKIRAMLHADPRFKHLHVSVNPPRMGKDYNDKLLAVIAQCRRQGGRPKQTAILR